MELMEGAGTERENMETGTKFTSQTIIPIMASDCFQINTFLLVFYIT